MQYRLIKSEPYKYSRDQFVKDGKTIRDGVRSYEARNNLRAMQLWDLCFWYHSNEWKEIVGIAKVSKTVYPDPTAIGEKWDWVAVDIVPERSLKRPVSLEHIKSDSQLADICLLKRQRLSVAPITEKEWKRVLEMAQ
jgi:predicted RNA-binding protein with PUA-like domain